MCPIFSPPDATVVNPRFAQIKISGAFPTTKTMIMPTTLDIGLLPLSSNSYKYTESKEYLVDELSYKNITIELTKFNHHLLTFGIYGRDFNTSSATHTNAALVLSIVSILAHFLV